MLEMGKIYKKETNRPLSRYQKEINEVAGELALKDPSLLGRRGELLDLACAEVQQRGYSYVKGKSRSKQFMSPPLQTPKPTRLKICAEIRQKKTAGLEEDIARLDKQLHFKNKRLQQAENIKNYKLWEDVTEEIQIVTRQKRDLSEELKNFVKRNEKLNCIRKRRKLPRVWPAMSRQMIVTFPCHLLGLPG